MSVFKWAAYATIKRKVGFVENAMNKSTRLRLNASGSPICFFGSDWQAPTSRVVRMRDLRVSPNIGDGIGEYQPTVGWRIFNNAQ